MSEKKYYWLKLKNDFFNQREIKKLRKIAGGDTFTIIYLKMQLLSIKNGGAIKFEGTESSFEEQLALELDEEIDNVKLTLAFLKTNSLLEPITDEDFLLNRVPELIGAETSAAERMRKMRGERNNVTPMLQNVTQSKRIELDIELDIKKDKNIVDLQTNTTEDVSSIVNYLNKKAGTSYRKSTPKTKALIKARMKEGFTLTNFEKVIDKKVAQWLGTDMEKFLRPETLFGTKFESYLNEKEKQDEKAKRNDDRYSDNLI